MKIYNKSAFFAGVLFACSLPIFALDVLQVDWWQWIVSVAFSVKFLYIGLSKEGSKRDGILREGFKEAATILYGRYHLLKINLPWIITAAYFAVALILRFLFKLFLPIWIHIAFVILLAVTVAYSIGITHGIEEYIEKQKTNSTMDTP